MKSPDKSRLAIFCAALVFLGILSGPQSVQAARFTGAYLLHLCEMDEKGKEKVEGGHAACQSYISGVIDYHNVLRSLNVAPRVDICIPLNVKLYDVQKIVLNFLRAHVEHDAFVAAPAVTMALYEIYPCR